MDITQLKNSWTHSSWKSREAVRQWMRAMRLKLYWEDYLGSWVIRRDHASLAYVAYANTALPSHKQFLSWISFRAKSPDDIAYVMKYAKYVAVLDDSSVQSPDDSRVCNPTYGYKSFEEALVMLDLHDTMGDSHGIQS